MSGKKSALCNNAEHSRVPTTLSTDLQILFLNENQINYVNREEFYRNGLEHLQRIYLKNSNVSAVHKDAFKNLKILVEIDLSENRIERIEKDTFNGNERLRILYLYGNPIKRLIGDQFPFLPHLRTLDMHDCQMVEVDRTAFRHLDQLEFLSLKNNSIPHLHATTFAQMQSLKTLILDENPWNCDCRLRKFRVWYVKTNANNKKLVCRLPQKFENKHWDAIEESYFGCLPTVELITDHNVQTEADIGITNVSFSCLVSGDPRPDVIWELNSNPLPDGFNVVTETTSGSTTSSSTTSTSSSGTLNNVDWDSEDNHGGAVTWSNLTILNVTSYDSGTYTCRASNLVGDASRNATLFLPEVVERVIVKTHETFWYFGLIIGTFGTIFALIFISVTVCYCRKAAIMRSARKNNMKNGKVGGGGGGHGCGRDGRGGNGMSGIRNGTKGLKGSVSFTDQEKKLLDLSLTTTTNDRQDSCELVNTPSTTTTLNNSISMNQSLHSNNRNCSNNKVESVIAVEQPAQSLQITIESQKNNMNGRNDEFPLNVSQFPPPPAEFSSCSISNSSPSMNNNHITNCNIPANPPHLYATTIGSSHHQTAFQHHHGAVTLANAVNATNASQQQNQFPHPGYGNIFIAVSMGNGQDALDNPDLNMYPDLLNIPSRIKSSMDGGSCGKADYSSHPPSNIIIVGGGGGKGYEPNKHKFINGYATTSKSNNMNYCDRGGGSGTSSIVGLGGISSLLSPPLPAPSHVPQTNFNSCPFATLPRHYNRHQHLGGGSGGNAQNNCLISPIGSGGSGQQMSPLLIKNTGLSNPIKIKDMPATIHEHDIVRYSSNLDSDPRHQHSSYDCSTMTEQPSSSSSLVSSFSRGGGGGATILIPGDDRTTGSSGSGTLMGHSCPIQYDNIGRRITASGNSAVKFTEDDELVIRYSAGGSAGSSSGSNKVRQPPYRRESSPTIDNDTILPNTDHPPALNSVDDSNASTGQEFVAL